MTASLSLKSVEFRREREAVWRRLDVLVSRAEKQGLHALGADDLVRLPALYRATLSSLSVATAISLDRNLIEYLEALSARAYVQVYGAKRGVFRAIARFLLNTFPTEFRRHLPHIGLAVLFLALGLAAGFFLTLDDPDRFYAFVSEEMSQGRTPGASTESLSEVLYSEGDDEASRLTAFSTFLFTHNSRIGMLAFALGFAAGLPVFFLLFANGLTLGAMAALYHSRGLAVDFWGWILPHGITELLAIAICGGAGLILAESLVFPGRRRRLENLRIRAREAARLVVGAVVMLFLAGLIEGVFRQTVHSVPVRYGVAAATLAMWIVYFTRLGARGRRA